MRAKQWMSKQAVAVAISVFLLGFLGGCGTVKSLYASLPIHDAGNASEEDKPALHDDPFLVDMARKFGLYALFAGTVYRDDYADTQRDGKGCDFLQPGYNDVKHLHYGMPAPAGNDGAGGPGWRRWIPEPSDEGVVACFEGEGLYYETYVLADAAGELEAAVIAFRGTENRQGQFMLDWGTNIAAFFGFEPKQYELVKDRVPDLARVLAHRLKKNSLGKAHIVAVGHSLGGGLAQQAGYLAPQITQVVTFNTSPITNWSQLRLNNQVKVAYPTIYRIYHTGEVLEKIRFVTTSFTSTRYARHDIGLQFATSSSFGGHSMQIILCGMADVLARQEPPVDGDFGYRLGFVNDGVLNNPTLCHRDRGASGP